MKNYMEYNLNLGNSASCFYFGSKYKEEIIKALNCKLSPGMRLSDASEIVVEAFIENNLHDKVFFSMPYTLMIYDIPTNDH